MSAIANTRRKKRWASRLTELVAAARSKPFTRGRFDCVMFAADAVLVVTGRDPAEGFRGTYATAEEAARAMIKYAGRPDVSSVVTKALGVEPSDDVRLARRGDVVAVETEKGEAVGVCVGEFAAVPIEGSGLMFIPTRSALRVWRVG